MCVRTDYAAREALRVVNRESILTVERDQRRRSCTVLENDKIGSSGVGTAAAAAAAAASIQAASVAVCVKFVLLPEYTVYRARLRRADQYDMVASEV